MDAAQDRTSRLARLKLVGELLRLKASIIAMPETDRLGRLRAVRRVLEIRRELGAGEVVAQPPAVAEPLPEVPATDSEDTGYESVGEARNPSAGFYDFNPNRKPSQRKRENAAAIDLLRQVRAGEVDGKALTGEQKAVLARYSGTGGNLVGEDGAQGSAYEYYTPKPIAEGAWELLREMGFAGGKVLDPCAGVGIFGGTAPASAVVDAVELNETSGQINELVNQGPGYSCKVSSFERVAASTPDGIYDAVISNVPFGNKTDRGSNYRDDPKYQDETLEGYFILRSLEKLKPGGLAAFICPPRCVSGKGGKDESVRLRASLMAEFMGAYRLPSTLFLSAGAETVTDLLVFRKHGAEALTTIQDLADSEPAKLREALVVWPEFVGGGYFQGDGKRFVLGEFEAKDPTKFRDVDRVISDKTPVEVAKLLRKFGGSRIDWALLNAEPTAPIIYRDGDTVTQGGQMLQMRDGVWVPIERMGDSPRAADLGGKLATPMHAFSAGLSLAEVAEWAVYMHTMSKSDEVPQWLQGTLTSVMRLAPADRARFWPVSITALCVSDVLDRHGRDSEPMHYATEYPGLSEAMQRHAADAGRIPTAAGSTIRDAAARLGIHYSRKAGFSATWRGDVVTERVDGRTMGQRFEAVKYAEGGTWVTREQAAEIYGASFDPIADPAWCISPDGRKVCRADDFFHGNYGDMLAMLKDQSAAATDETVRGKLLGMAQEAHTRVQRVDASKVGFNLASPFVTVEEKAEFLRRYYGEGFSVNYESGEAQIDYEPQGYVGKMDEEKHKLLRRMAYYVRNGTVTLQGSKFKDDKKALAALRKMAREANEQFGAYCRANQTITRRLEEQANDPARMHFPQTRNTDPVPLPGWKMGTPPDGVTPWGYQYAEIRRRGQFFGGINGYGVGLGKSFTALACVQHAQAIGIKKRTAFVVPNSVLSNWRKEAATALEDMGQCLFVGLGVDKKGNPKMDPSAYDADLTRAGEGRHSKIFMTFEAFRRLRLRDETLDRYLDSMGETNSAFETAVVKEDGNIEPLKAKTREAVAARGSRLADAITKGHSASAPFLEELGIDSIVLDEAHVAKNSAKLNDFKGAKFLSIADPSGIGMDLQAKAAFIRGLSPKKDGVLLLTATPVTNSPIEVYSMLSLAVGADRVNDMAMGIKGPDDFMKLVCEVESEEDETLDGILRDTRVFKGLQNVSVLRRAIAEVITIETPETVGMTIQLPDADARATPVAMPDPPMIERLKLYKGAYRWAVDKMAGRGDDEPFNRGSKAAYDLVAARFNEPIDLIGHPFNIVRKMTAAIMDPELDDIATFYTVPAGGSEKAAAVVAQFNALKIEEERARPGPRTLPGAVVGEKSKKVDGDKVSVLVIRVAAVIEGDRIVIDSIDPDTIAKFEKLEEKAGLDLDVSVPPKLAAMLDNFRKEEMTPRGVDDEGKPSPVVKQIIFCDILAMHAKIKRLLRKQAGVPGGAIAIITGRTNNKPEDILAVQDGFNAHGAANKFRVVIANEKAEVGINLQRGTQAIHHLTIGWTPDSLTQRDGRGVRQGNKTERVSVYSYDADGTFDQHKRGMVNKKADWIDNVMDINGGTSIAIDGGLTVEQQEALIETVGDADAMNRFTESLAAKEREARRAGVRERQAVALKTIRANQKLLADNDSLVGWAGTRLASFASLVEQEKKLGFAAQDAKSEAKKASASAALVDVQARMGRLEREISGAFDIAALGFASVRAMAALAVSNGGKDYNFENTLYDYKAKKKAVPIEGSALQSDWEFERSQAEAMIKASRDQFASYSARDGGIPADVVDKVIAGDGHLIGDVPVVRGMIIVKAGTIYVARSGEGASVWRDYGRGPSLEQADVGRLMPFDEAHYPGGDSYPAAAERAAAVEDGMLSAAPMEYGQTNNLFATLNEVIASRRKAAGLIEIDRRRLPPPHFPFVITPRIVGSDPVLQSIHDQQRAIVKTVDNRDCVDAATAATLLPADYNLNVLQTLREWCAARGERVSIYGANRLLSLSSIRYGEAVTRFLLPTGTATAFNMEVVGTSEDEIKASGLAWLARHAPQLDIGALSLDSVLPPHLAGIVSAKIRALTAPPPVPTPVPTPAPASAPAASAAPEPAKVAPPAAAPAPAPDAVDPASLKDTDMVGIRGDTRPVKDFIKAVANEMGGYRWAKDSAQWNVQFRAWKAIIERRPDLAKTLEMTIYRAR